MSTCRPNHPKIWHNLEMTRATSRLTAVLLALLVTSLWSTSWVLIKLGLRSDLPPVTFAGLRYTLAFLSLTPLVVWNSHYRRQAAGLKKPDWSRLAILGLFTYTLSQASMFVALSYLSAAMLGLVLNLTSLFVALAAILALKESPSSRQWVGITLTLLGIGVYFLPLDIGGTQWAGLLFAFICLASNVPSSLLSRQINRTKTFSPLIVTWASMGVGSLLMLLAGLLTQGLGHISWSDWVIIAWLAFVNTALAFTLWNYSLRTLTATEASVINNLMLPQIAILAWLFLNETLSSKQIVGLILVGVGVLIVQLRRSNAAQRTGVPSERPI
jgi:drug/metabolite transporter (DMT)-like permease